LEIAAMFFSAQARVSTDSMVTNYNSIAGVLLR
jgi:hypothetical protein